MTLSPLGNFMTALQMLNNVFLYFDGVKQLGVGQVYTYLDVSNRIALKVSLGPCTFDFSCLLRFVAVENV